MIFEVMWGVEARGEETFSWSMACERSMITMRRRILWRTEDRRHFCGVWLWSMACERSKIAMRRHMSCIGTRQPREYNRLNTTA